ncbi:MAG: GNAT family N-acetyltransferase [Actinomycetales bacterium]|nr:GNAT family N-acetyltransferase [Actinomycetales bacterium]
MEIREAALADVSALVALAARTFPLACPPSLSTESIERFIADNLNAESFTDWIEAPTTRVTVGVVDGVVSAYLVLIDEGEARFVSKCYAAPEFHGHGLADALLNEAIEFATARDAHWLRLGVNKANVRAIRFYERHGFVIVGERTFTVGDQIESDHVLELALTSA